MRMHLIGSIKRSMTDKHRIKPKCVAVAVMTALVLSGCMSVSINEGVLSQNAQPVESANTQMAEQTDETEEKESEEVIKDQETNEGGNLIPGGDFTASNPSWGLYMESGGSASFDVSDGELRLHIADPGKVAHAVQLYCCGFQVLEGGKYHFSAEIESDVERTFEWRIQINGGDYHPYCSLKNVSDRKVHR